MLHPDLLSNLYEYQHQERLREVETWRLARAARQNRARYVSQFLHRLVAAVRQRLSLQARPTLVKPDQVNFHR